MSRSRLSGWWHMYLSSSHGLGDIWRGICWKSAHDPHVLQYLLLVANSPSSRSIPSLVSVLPPFCSGEVGDEKIPETGSNPCSSRMPVSFNVMPVFLRACHQYCPPNHTYPHINRAYLPTLPTSKYWLPVCLRRPGVVLFPAGAIPRGG